MKGKSRVPQEVAVRNFRVGGVVVLGNTEFLIKNFILNTDKYLKIQAESIKLIPNENGTPVKLRKEFTLDKNQTYYYLSPQDVHFNNELKFWESARDLEDSVKMGAVRDPAEKYRRLTQIRRNFRGPFVNTSRHNRIMAGLMDHRARLGK